MGISYCLKILSWINLVNKNTELRLYHINLKVYKANISESWNHRVTTVKWNHLLHIINTLMPEKWHKRIWFSSASRAKCFKNLKRLHEVWVNLSLWHINAMKRWKAITGPPLMCCLNSYSPDKPRACNGHSKQKCYHWTQSLVMTQDTNKFNKGCNKPVSNTVDCQLGKPCDCEATICSCCMTGNSSGSFDKPNTAVVLIGCAWCAVRNGIMCCIWNKWKRFIHSQLVFVRAMGA